jgi:hypothetical protein
MVEVLREESNAPDANQKKLQNVQIPFEEQPGQHERRINIQKQVLAREVKKYLDNTEVDR